MHSQLFAQRDFSGGQVNSGLRRRDDQDAVRTGAKTMLNWRIEAPGQLVPRPGKRPVFGGSSVRNDYVRMGVGHEYLLGFGPGVITITDLVGNVVFTNSSGSYLWASGTMSQIQWAQAGHIIVVTFPLMQPQVLSWDQNTVAWTTTPFVFATGNGQSFAPFYNFRQDGATMSYNGTTGSILLVCSENFFSPNMVGQYMSIVGQQVVLTTYYSPTQMQASVIYRLPDIIAIPVLDTTPFQVGQVVTAQVQNIKFEVTMINGGAVYGVLISQVSYNVEWVWKPDGTNPDTLIGPYGSSQFTNNPNTSPTYLPQPTTQWQEQFMSSVRGWPASCFFDRDRLGFCDFPQKPESILWSAIGAYTTFWIDSAAAATQPEAGAAADSAILEGIPPSEPSQGVPRVRHVVPWGDEFAFTDRGIFQIPITTAGNPLKPGSVEFRQFSNDGVAPIRPVTSQDVIVYMNAGANRMCVVRATGSYTRPYITQDMSDNHTDLFNSPVTFTIASGDGQYPVRQVYVMNADGSIIVGKFTADRQFVGWLPWSSQGKVNWVSSAGSNVYFNSTYSAQNLLETEDNTTFMDMTLLYNAPPAPLVRAGKGPLWFLGSGTVTLMDGNRDLGERTVDQNGYLVPIQGEDLSSPTLVVGLYSAPTLVPFVPGSQPGDDMGQRQKRRKIKRVMVNVQNSSGFTLGNKTFPPVYFEEDPTGQPTLRDGAFQTRTIGRQYDPGVTLVKDRPGPLRICELSLEVTI